MAQYYQIIQNVDDLKQLGLDCVLMNEDGTPFNPQSVVLSEPTQVIETNQIPQIIYQQNAQPNQTMHTDGQIHYVVQEDDLPGDSYSLVQQPGTQQVFYQKLNTDTAPQLIQQHAKAQTELTNIIEVNPSQVQYQQNSNQQQLQQQQYQQIVIQNYQQNPQQVLHVYQQPQMQSSPTQQLIQVQSPVQQQQQPQPQQPQHQQHQTSPQTIQLQSPSQVQSPVHAQANRIQIQAQNATQVRKIFPQEVVRQRFIQRVPNTLQIQMTTPQKMMQPTAIVHPTPNRFQAPARTPTRMVTQQRAPRPRAPTIRTRAPTNVNVRPVFNSTPIQLAATSTPNHRPRLALTRITSPSQQMQPVVTIAGTKTIVSIANSPKTFTVNRPSAPNAIKTNNITASTSNSTTVTEDLEESISAATIAKQLPVQQMTYQEAIRVNDCNDNNRLVTLQNGQTMTLTEFKQRQAQASVQHLTGIKPMSRVMAGTKPKPRFTPPQMVRAQIRPVNSVQVQKQIIQQHHQHQQQQQQQHQQHLQQQQQQQQQQIQQQQQQQHLQQQQLQSHQQTVETVVQMQQQSQPPPQQQPTVQREAQESARMLIVLENGEQRLITFTLPKERCTINELLEQIGIPFEPDTNIQCRMNPGVNIDYLVTVGVNISDTPTDIITAAENSLQQKQRQTEIQQEQQHQVYQTQPVVLNQNHIDGTKQLQKHVIMQQQVQQKAQPQIMKANAAQVPKIAPRYISGYLAVCNACGYSSNNHAQCQRCARVFTEETKKIAINTTISTTPKPKQAIQKTLASIEKQKKENFEQIQKKFQISERMVPNTRIANRSVTFTKRKKAEEPVILTLSSDEEDETNTSGTQNPVNNTDKWLPMEPELVENEDLPDFHRENVTDLVTAPEKLSTKFRAKTIFLGTYVFETMEDVTITSKGIRIVAPNIKHPNEKTLLDIQKSEIVKICAHFSRKSSLVLYVLNTCSRYIRDSLEMSTENRRGYFSSVSSNVGEKRIVIEADTITEMTKSVIKSIFPLSVMEEISFNDMSIIQNQIRNSVNTMTSGEKSYTILIYPPTGKGGITIQSGDYTCLAIDQYLNDTIIDFYLKYLEYEVLTTEQRQRTFMFSQFFYNSLTNTKLLGTSNDGKLTAAQKRHKRVKNWTKNVNIFEKDFIIIPINQQSHWFLAIVCFPTLKGPVTMVGNQPVKLKSTAATAAAKKKAAATAAAIASAANTPTNKKNSIANVTVIGSTTIMPVSKKEPENIERIYDEESERDEAEGDESDLESAESEAETTEAQPTTQPIKQPCILIFDSLPGGSRSRVVATIRDYLTCEYREKIKTPADHTFDRFNMIGHSVKVPLQTNYTDCGLYLLQYVEQFFKDPIINYRTPIKQLINWFDLLTVTKKREDIALLIKDLAIKNGRAIQFPDITLPTENGQLLDTPDFLEEHGDFEDDESTLVTQEDIPPEPPVEIEKNALTPATQKKRILLRKPPNQQNNDNNTETKKRRT